MIDYSLDFFEAWDALDEAVDSDALKMSYEEVKQVLTNPQSDNSESKEKLKDLMIKLCKDRKGIWKTDPSLWPYQLQLMYNSYVLECIARQLLIERADDINNGIKQLADENLNKRRLPKSTDWHYCTDKHYLLTTQTPTFSKPEDYIDLQIADNKDDNIITRVEVKGTAGSITNATNFHKAKAAIIFLLSKDKKSAKAYFSLIPKDSDKVTMKNSVPLGNIAVDCLNIIVHDPVYPTVDELEVDGKLLSPEQAKGKEITNPIDDNEVG